MTLAARVTAGLGRLRVTQGAGAGDPFRVLPWQRRFIAGALAPGVQTAALSVARGAGKTTLAAALALAALAGPLARRRGEVVLVASSFEQAKIGFGHVLAFMAGALEAAPARWRVQDSANRASIEDRQTGAKVRAIGSDPRRAHGLAPALAILDEGAQWPSSTSEAMLAALRTSLGKLPGARLLALGTRPADPGHWLARLLDGGADYAQIHAARPDDPPFQARTWRRANPSLASMPELERVTRREAAEARRDPGALASFRALRLNLGTADVTRAMLIDADVWKAAERAPDALPARAGPSAWGIDLGGTAALSAVAAYWPATGRLEAVAMAGDDPGLGERGLRDGVGALYRDCAGAGDLVTAPGRVVPVQALLALALSRFGAPGAIAADRWRQGELVDALTLSPIPRCPLSWRGQGFRDGGEDVRAFRQSVLAGRVVPVRSLLMRAAMAEAVTLCDPAGNAKLAKGHEGGRRLRARDDVAAAAILAVAEGARRGGVVVPSWRAVGVV